MLRTTTRTSIEGRGGRGGIDDAIVKEEETALPFVTRLSGIGDCCLLPIDNDDDDATAEKEESH